MILITKMATSILIQKDGAEIVIDMASIPSALPAIIGCLIDSGRQAGQARKEGYDAGLAQGYAQCEREQAVSARIATRQAQDLVDAIIGVNMANAA